MDDTSPRTIHHYTSLTPIDPPGPNYGLQGHMLKATFYKAFSSVDGKTYCIHRVHGLSQILFQHPPKTIKTLQRQDFASVGFTFLSILSRTMNPQSSLAECMASVQLSYSLELNQLISMLISNNSRVNVDMILATYSHRLLAEYDLSLNRLDEMEANLSLELENGRLFRIISKLNFIIGRPGLKSDNKWSETGERYIISLFFGHIFHQVEADLKPVVDIAHVVMNLNKLDAGSTEHILLTSGDEKTCLVVTYKYIKECVEAAFNELLCCGGTMVIVLNV
ncbi:PAB-dependent poly(A)-specific ribonuclease subunit pan3 [Zancudomyces culisetae]|uniref:PAB-dependent poly(A)-specific ribonuclease subunit pan3 n=1 Tax=Zancudomyces culisetae TaxID=1213189 RepID=A0A1R1PTA3_ZANCU|nr:PAB-dependent poly(A)-specific ribonuclease subunit pan3 [Zancudomyces culisetae]|eukprot:OMH84122.1 PAB-dependent poly(A)-specific ribonuclease subunit pan3 [Zancudomyces culisetae]